MFRRRRPLLGAAMIGGAVHAGRKAGQNQAYAQQQEQDQEDRLAQLESQQAPAPAAAAPAADDMVSKIKELQALKDQGILTDEEFQAAKSKVISG